MSPDDYTGNMQLSLYDYQSSMTARTVLCLSTTHSEVDLLKLERVKSGTAEHGSQSTFQLNFSLFN